MKITTLALIIGLITATGCSGTQTKEINLTEKSVYRVKIDITDLETRKIITPNRLYFARLDSETSWESNHLIASTAIDAEGRIFINPLPGVYALVAAERIMDNHIVITCFDNELILKTARRLNIGEEQTNQLRVIDYTDTLFDKTPTSVRFYKKRIAKPQNDYTYYTIGKFYSSPESIQKLKDEKKKAEEVSATIEKY